MREYQQFVLFNMLGKVNKRHMRNRHSDDQNYTHTEWILLCLFLSSSSRFFCCCFKLNSIINRSTCLSHSISHPYSIHACDEQLVGRNNLKWHSQLSFFECHFMYFVNILDYWCVFFFFCNSKFQSKSRNESNLSAG